MRSLFVRFFLSYWLIIGVTIGSAALGGFWYAERMREAVENFELENSILDASAALESGGREGLTQWLSDFPQSRAVRIFVIDESGDDILGRRPPFGVMRSFRRYNEHLRRHIHDDTTPGNLRHARPLPQLIAANGETYTLIVAPTRLSGNLWATADARFLLLLIALVVSGLVSYALANAISRPVRKLRDATVALADGDLDVRVASSIGKRRDELGMLGRDFDTMAGKLQSAVEQQSELSRNISHELRSPLARMRVAVELAKRQAGDLPEFDRLEGEAERLDSLIGQILSYTRLDSGSARDPEAIDLADVISEVAENVNFECKSDGIKGVTVVTEIQSLGSFHGYRDALVSAIENIVRNAVYHCPANSDVTISLSQGQQQAIIEIRDHGAGVDSADIERLFEPFFRTQRSAESETSHGTGLGLAIAARAIQVNRGEISARNHADGGLLVRIALPL